MRYRVLLTVAAAVAATDALTKAAAVALSRWMPVGLPGGWVLRVAHLADIAVACGLALLLALTVCGRASLARTRPAVTR